MTRDRALPLLLAYRATVRNLELELHQQKTTTARLSFEKELKETTMNYELIATAPLDKSAILIDDLDYVPIRESSGMPNPMKKPTSVTFDIQDDWFGSPAKPGTLSPFMQTLRASDLRNSESSHLSRGIKPQGTPVKEMLDQGSTGKLHGGLTIDELLTSPKRSSRLYLPVQEFGGSFLTLDSSRLLSTGQPANGLFRIYSSSYEAVERLPLETPSPAVLEVSVPGQCLETAPGEFLASSVLPLRPLLLPRLKLY